jgi:hypothetical protein
MGAKAMEWRLARPASQNEFDDRWDLDTLLHPAQAFDHPADVVDDPELTLNEKRAILASWASDACAVEAVPTLRRVPGGKEPVHFDEVMDALRVLDAEARRSAPRTAGAKNSSRHHPRSGTAMRGEEGR